VDRWTLAAIQGIFELAARQYTEERKAAEALHGTRSIEACAARVHESIAWRRYADGPREVNS
jgi:hypothetical protein